MNKWRGVLEVFEEVEAETEEEATKQMAAKLIEQLNSKTAEFIVWPNE
jgi:aspartate/glutamate racemase